MIVEVKNWSIQNAVRSQLSPAIAGDLLLSRISGTGRNDWLVDSSLKDR